MFGDSFFYESAGFPNILFGADVARKSIYYKAAEKTKYQSLESYQRYTTEELELFEENTGLKERQLRALKALGLPTTLEEFVKHRKTKGQPYEAALNNQILDHKFALWSNTGITESKDGSNPIAYDPAVLDPLITVEKFIKTKKNVNSKNLLKLEE